MVSARRRWFSFVPLILIYDTEVIYLEVSVWRSQFQISRRWHQGVHASVVVVCSMFRRSMWLQMLLLARTRWCCASEGLRDNLVRAKSQMPALLGLRDPFLAILVDVLLIISTPESRAFQSGRQPTGQIRSGDSRW